MRKRAIWRVRTWAKMTTMTWKYSKTTLKILMFISTTVLDSRMTMRIVKKGKVKYEGDKCKVVEGYFNMERK